MGRHSSIPTTGWGDYTCHMVHYKFAVECRSDNVDQFTKLIGIVANTDCIATPPLHRGNVARCHEDSFRAASASGK